MSPTVRDNKKLWRLLERTDKEYTKPVAFGGRTFTTINAQWQIMKVTEVLGPVGHGWGYDVAHSTLTLSDKLTVCFADVTTWWSDGEGPKAFFGPVRGCAELYHEAKSGRMMLDDDAPKKAMTDALTKALSHIGVSADIFLGKYEDNKYVARITREFAAEKIADGPLPSAVSIALEQLPNCKNVDELDEAVAHARPAMGDWEPIHRDLYAIRARERKLQLGGSVPAE